VSLEGTTLYVKFPYDETYVAVCRALKSKWFKVSRWDGVKKAWVFPFAALADVQEAFPEFQLDASVQSKLAEFEAQKAVKQAEESAEAAARKAKTESLLAAVEDLNQPLPSGRILYKHQQEGVLRILNAHKLILADDMGLGKTTTALVAAKAFQKALGCSIFVLARISLHDTAWRRDAAVVGTEIEIYSNHVSRIPQAPVKPFVLIVDEAHDYQSLTSKRTEAMLKLVASPFCEGVMLLTGTPIKNGRPANLFPLLLAIEHPLSKNRKAFEQRYCAAGPTRWSRWDVSGAAHLDELHTLTKEDILRRMKKDCLDLPEKTRVVRKAEMSDSAAAEYQATLRRLVTSYRERLRKGEIMTGGEALVELTQLRHAGSIGKVETAVELAEEVVEEGRQAVVFTEFEASVGRIVAALEAKGIPTVKLTGATPQKDRGGIVDSFQSGAAKVFVGTVKAGGVGLTLTAADTVILVDRPWTPGDAIQAEDRTHRIGQASNVTAVWVQANGVDERVDKLLLSKQQRIDMVLEGKRKTMRGVDSSATEIAMEVMNGLLEEAF
jgi:SNF2 family DNA or RNA helicase